MFKREAEATSEVDICRTDIADAFNQGAIGGCPFSVSEPSEDGSFMPSVDAIDIECWIRFSVAEFLSFFESVSKR